MAQLTLIGSWYYYNLKAHCDPHPNENENTLPATNTRAATSGAQLDAMQNNKKPLSTKEYLPHLFRFISKTGRLQHPVYNYLAPSRRTTKTAATTAEVQRSLLRKDADKPVGTARHGRVQGACTETLLQFQDPPCASHTW
jgi:hypothetical protein